MLNPRESEADFDLLMLALAGFKATMEAMEFKHSPLLPFWLLDKDGQKSEIVWLANASLFTGDDRDEDEVLEVWIPGFKDHHLVDFIAFDIVDGGVKALSDGGFEYIAEWTTYEKEELGRLELLVSVN